MKVNFNKTFKDYRGNDLIVGGKVQLMTDIIAPMPFLIGEGARSSGDSNKDSSRKIHSYELCMRLIQANGDLSISAEDAILIKESVIGLTPGCYSQIVKLIDE